MDTRKNNTAFQDYEKSLLVIRDERGEKKPWSGTETYKDATEIIKTGFKDPLEKMKKDIVKIDNTEKPNRPKLKMILSDMSHMSRILSSAYL